VCTLVHKFVSFVILLIAGGLKVPIEDLAALMQFNESLGGPAKIRCALPSPEPILKKIPDPSPESHISGFRSAVVEVRYAFDI